MSRFLVRLEKLARALLQKRVEPKSLRRIIVAHNLLLGDTILLAPLLKALAELAPDAERYVLCRPAFLPLFENHPYGVTAIPFSRKDAASQRHVLRSGPYDLAIVPDDNRYAWLARGAGAGWITGFANDRPKWKNWMLDRAFDYSATPNAWADMVPSLIHASRVQPFEIGEWNPPDYRSFNLPERPYVVLHVGASTPLKQWPAERWKQVAEQMRAAKFQIAWSGAASERQVLDEISPAASEAALFGCLDIGQLWHLLHGASLLVCPDTGVAHLARIIGVPTVSIFGPGSAVVHGAGKFFGEARFHAVTVAEFPCRDQTVLFRRNVPWVRRCGRGVGIGRDQCPEPLCMQAVSVSDVLQFTEPLLAPTEERNSGLVRAGGTVGSEMTRRH
jgi:ADP-heptose:LPS heptosyltransferase